ncbi:hypothetical protein PG997_002795 [Apiospora hydei]|uniref:Aminoglycoside phosphotransferase domain-containing protein n=1 Tax=Apiospora hydei TaxID=1337664 RepID=A0ABR1WXE2_9PEZI
MPTSQSHSSTQSNMGDSGEYATSFEERRPKILEICQDLWPGAAISITSPSGGDRSVEEYFIAVSYSSYLDGMNQHLNHDRYVLQIPRRPDEVADRAAVLGHIDVFGGEGVQLLTPEAFHVNRTPDNPLGRPYLILTEHPGCNLGKVYQNMSQEQKIKVATELGRAFCELQVDPAPFCGYPSTDPNEDDGEGRCIKPFQIKKNDNEADSTDWDAMMNFLPADVDHTEEDPAAALTRASFLKDGTPHLKARQIVRLSFLRWIHHNRHSSSSSSTAPWKRDANERLLQRSLAVLEEIMRRNPDVFDSDHICLHNPALGAAENILVEFAGDEGRERESGAPQIMGIVDWASTAFEPRFAGCRPPDWLWSFPRRRRRRNDPVRGPPGPRRVLEQLPRSNAGGGHRVVPPAGPVGTAGPARPTDARRRRRGEARLRRGGRAGVLPGRVRRRGSVCAAVLRGREGVVALVRCRPTTTS